MPAGTRPLVDGHPGTPTTVPPGPVRAPPAERTLGEVLGELSRRADGELLTKLDDDDHYGPDHVADLFLAWHSVGADLVAKGAWFGHVPERGETPGLGRTGGLRDHPGRRHAAAQSRRPGPGRRLEPRPQARGRGPTRPRAQRRRPDLPHPRLEYVYVRRTSGHTFVADTGTRLAHGERTYPGLPPEIVRPDRV